MLLLKTTLFLLLFAIPGPKETMKPHVISYIDEYKYLAIDEMVRSGIPASVTMAQAIIESNGGVSYLAKESNNHFGIKCKSYWTGSEYYHPDDDRDAEGNIIPSCFRKYDSVNASYADHSDFLMNTPHYQGLFGYDRTDYEMWARGLQLCGYASDPAYADKLIRTIKLYNLHELDYYTIQYVKKSTLTSASEVSISKN
jgi:flagellum-specific peptidoglycan hydrolase FlgJ